MNSLESLLFRVFSEIGYRVLEGIQSDKLFYKLNTKNIPDFTKKDVKNMIKIMYECQASAVRYAYDIQQMAHEVEKELAKMK